MPKRMWDPSLPANQLLARLPRDEFQRLFPVARPITFKLKDVLFESGEDLEYAYFPNTGVISQITVMEDGEPIELATVGNEGMVGLPIALGIIESSSKAMVQVPSTGLRLAASKLVAEMSRDTPLRRLLLRYAALLSVSGFAGRCVQRLALGKAPLLPLAAHDTRSRGRR